MYRGAFAVVDLEAVRHNVRVVKSRLGAQTRLMVAVKADGYGHGAVPVARAALSAGATDLGVATVEEAIELRQAGVRAPVLVLGAVSPQAAREAARQGVAVTLTDDWSRNPPAPFDACLDVHLKVDTGMNRLGFRDIGELVRVARWVAARPDMRLAGVFTHLAVADAADTSHAERQMRQFQAALGALAEAGLRPPLAHAANSAAALRFPAWQFDMVRLGISAYGYQPNPALALPVPLRPALHLYAFITRLCDIEPGETVGYGATFVARRRTRIATVPVGYADGYPRWLSNRGCALVRGHRVPVAGRVCMDQLMLDVTDVPGVQAGDCVTLYGRQAPGSWRADGFQGLEAAAQEAWIRTGFRAAGGDGSEAGDGTGAGDGAWLSLDELAQIGQTISYELMCALSPRIPRVYV
ncbi:MAG: alanine racemase [Alicyclobacillaceae bacterium]|nr:alanine racemase [Alicyclobacillaceae bacterium]